VSIKDFPLLITSAISCIVLFMGLTVNNILLCGLRGFARAEI